MRSFHFQTRVSYGDVDKDLSLTLPGAMRMMQEAAIIHSDQSGYSVRDVERTRVVWMLIQWRTRLVGRAMWNEMVEVVTWPQTMEKLTSSRCFLIKNAAGETVALAESNWVLVNVDTGRVMRIPPEVISAYDLVPDGVFEDRLPKLPRTVGVEVCSFPVLRRDIDTNDHVNNLVYLDYAREALPPEAADKTYPEIIVHYHQQLLLGDLVHCHYTPLESGHLVQICSGDPAHVHCTVLFIKT